jgi:hypothetical protein
MVMTTRGARWRERIGGALGMVLTFAYCGSLVGWWLLIVVVAFVFYLLAINVYQRWLALRLETWVGKLSKRE